MRKILKLVLCLVVFTLGARSLGAAEVTINEFLASNSRFYADEDGQFADWIELYNGSGGAVNLAGWALTDDETQPRKWEFPDVTIPASGYVVVYASGKNRTTPRLHTNFSLDADGEYLALAKPDGTIVSSFNPFVTQRRDISYGYDLSGTLVFFATPSPGAVNSSGVVDFVKDTKFSHSRGYYSNSFALTITTATEGATIRYTTNGVPPTATTGTVYSGPVSISGTTVLRAAAFKSGLQPSNVDTQTYLFLEDVIRQSPNGAPPPGWPSSWGANTVDYGMDPDVVNDPRYSGTIKDDLRSLPAFSVVLKLSDLFDSTTGIYANPGQEGRAWERPCSVELINQDGTPGFQIDAGIRIRGGFSRSTGNPKHAFRLFFREDYGAGKLEYPLFGNEGTDQFDGIDLRTFQNYSWSFQGDANGVFLRDQFSRDTQLAMGSQAERGNFYHLYINGVYWGIYNTCERPEASYAESYFGGNKEDYDVIKTEAGPYTIFATDGTMTMWNALYNACKLGVSTDTAFQKLLGNNPDGTPNPAYPVLVDLGNLIDYMLVIIYSGNLDAPISNFLGNDSPNNWFGSRNRNIEARQGFQFFAHDSEHTLLPWNAGVDRTGPFAAGETSVSKSNPQWVWQKLSANAEFRLKVADHVHRHFFNNGLLTPAQNAARFNFRKEQIDRAVVAESARWGDAKRSTPLNRNDHWVPAINDVLNNYFPQRTTTVLNQLQAKNLYPAVAAPTFSQHGGNVAAGFNLTMNAPTGTIYYTIDGSDPRLMGGAVSASAVRYTRALQVNESMQVKSRVLSGTEWSALNEATFYVIRIFKELVITELMYNPVGSTNLDGDQYEFLELKNIGASELDVGGVRFTNGISYTFPLGTRVSPGDFMVLVANPEAFAERYPGVVISGVYTNGLSNGGEPVALVHAAGGLIASFTYDDLAPWPLGADGAGFSLVPRIVAVDSDLNTPLAWRASSRTGGSPGANDPPMDVVPVVINEVLTHTDPPQVDAIELHNPGSVAAEIGGWYLSDDRNTPKKYRIAPDTRIEAGGFKVFRETDFNATPGVQPSFALSSLGDEVYLFSADATETLTGYIDGWAFGAAENGVSFGRHTNSAGILLFPAQTSVTLERANSGPRVGPVVINEIRYAPASGEEEFVELKNITGQAVKLYDPANPANTWVLDGAGFTFPQGTEIPANGILVVSATDPVSFRARNSVPQTVQVMGPFAGTLQDNGEMLELKKPDAPEVLPEGTVVPYIVADAVRYDEGAPWPVEAAGAGPSLERLDPNQFGNEPINWRASPGPASPGLENTGNRLPIVNAGPDLAVTSASFPVVTNLLATVRDDGLPNNQLTYRWSAVSGPGAVQITNGDRLDASFSFPGTGQFTLKLEASDGEFTGSDLVVVVISRPLATVTLVQKGSSWKYNDTGTDLGTAWRELNYVETGWLAGPAELGYGDGSEGRPEATPIASGPSGARYITYYFRHSFDVQDPAAFVDLKVALMRDDGGIVYLNGTEIFRSNMPEGTVTFSTVASGVVGGGDETAFLENAVAASLLRSGKNVIAVEVHQNSGGSSDVSFDLELSGTANFSNRAPTVSAGPDLNVTLPQAAELAGSASDDGLPNPPGVFATTWTFVSGPGNVVFANPNLAGTTASFSAPGAYVLRLSVTDGQLTQQDTVNVNVAGGDEFTLWRAQYFSGAELSDPNISGDLADPDTDSFSNRDEFVAGTNPKDGMSFLQVAEVGRENDELVITFEAVAGKSYTLQACDDVETGEWRNVTSLSPQGATQWMEFLDNLPTRTHQFYRLVTPEQRLN